MKIVTRHRLRSLLLALMLATPLGLPAQEPIIEESPPAVEPASESTTAPEIAVAPEATSEPAPAPQPVPVQKRKKVRAPAPEATPPAEVAAEATPPVEAEDADSPAAAGDDADGLDVDVNVDSDDVHSNGIVSVGHDSTLAAGEKAAAVVSIFGSSTSHGEVSDGVVSVMGDTTVTGPVGDAVVAVMGDVHLDSKIAGDAVAVMGNMDLGPNAEVGGQVVVIGGTLTRAPTAITHGGVQQILTGTFAGFKWLRPWFEHCLLYGRPLAFAPGLGWAWTLALGFLAFYVLLAFLFRGAMDRCVATFEAQPGKSVLASFLTQLLSPVVIVLLCVTVVGIALVPFLGIGLLIAAIFGKAVMLALLGKRVTNLFGESPFTHTAMAVLVGGVLVLGLYVIPVVGFITFKVLGILGLGVVVYTVLLVAKSERELRAAAAAAAAPAAAPPPAAVAPTAAATAGVASSSFAPASESTATAGVGSEPIPPPAAATVIADAATMPRAGFWVRMAALLIDLILVGIAVHFMNDIDNVLLILLATYGAVMWKLKGTTIGGIVLGLKVVRLDGRPLDWTTSIVRALSCFLSLAVVGLGFIWILFDDERQAWHDKIAGTVVVRLPKGVSLV